MLLISRKPAPQAYAKNEYIKKSHCIAPFMLYGGILFTAL